MNAVSMTGVITDIDRTSPNGGIATINVNGPNQRSAGEFKAPFAIGFGIELNQTVSVTIDYGS